MMQALIILTFLIMAMAAYRLGNWRCRLLYDIWEHKRVWGDFYAAIEQDQAMRRAIAQAWQENMIIPRIAAAARGQG